MSFKPVYTFPDNNCFVSMLCTHYDDLEYLESLLKTDIALWNALSRNPHAIPLLKNHPEHINWAELSCNPRAICLLKDIEPRNLVDDFHGECKLDWVALSSMPETFEFVKKLVGKRRMTFLDVASNPHPEAMKLVDDIIDVVGPSRYPYWHELSGNPSAIHILEKHIEFVGWWDLSKNPNAVHLLEQNLDKVSWWNLSQNPNAIHILERNLNKIRWGALSCNPNAIHLLKRHPDKIEWNQLADNPNPEAALMLKANLDKTNTNNVWYSSIGRNPNVALIVGKLDTTRMRNKCRPFARELAETVFHPSRLLRLCDTYHMDLVDYMEALGD